jgi:hypothetical protein
MKQDEIIKMARQVGFSEWAVQTPNDLITFAKLVEERTAAKEREACAMACEDLNLSQDSTWQVATLDCAEAIRARGKA